MLNPHTSRQKTQLLLTSFQTWLPHQTSNASDDLLQQLSDQGLLTSAVRCLRQLPVDFEIAPRQVIQAIEQFQPRVIVLCGMAEGRSSLSLEAQAKHQGSTLATSIDLNWLISGTKSSQISLDSGNFVCNRLYYNVLQWLLLNRHPSQALFIHIPPLSEHNQLSILSDFMQIFQKLMLHKQNF